MRRLVHCCRRRSVWRRDDGLATAEYAVATVAACGFAALLFRILTSAQIYRIVDNLIVHALHLL
jgi:hypothetical protein